ncbi:MAG: oligosaccharide flippase family protein [bacterium]|nr:oligosaccharide flippase family protein [bacterium]
MSNVKKVAQNSTIILGGSLLNRFFEVICILLLADILEVEEMGYYRAVFFYFSLWALVIDLGTQHIITREGAREKEKLFSYIYSGFAIGTVVFAAIAILSYAVLQTTTYPQDVKDLFFYGLLSVIVSSRFKSYRKIFEIIFVVDFKMLFPTILNVLDRLVFLTFLFVFIRFSHSLPEAVLYTVIADAIGFSLLVIIYIIKYKAPKFNFDLSQWKFLTLQSWPMLFSSFLNVLNLRISHLIVTGILAGTEAGIYAIALLIAESMSFIPYAVARPIFPVLSQKFVKSSEVFFRVYRVMIKYLLLIVFPIVTYLIIELDEIITLMVRLFLREEYLATIEIARILLISEIFLFAFVGFVNGIIASNKQIYNIIVTAVSAACNIILLLILIPRYGLNGAATSVVISFGVYLLTGLLISAIRTYVLIIIRTMISQLIVTGITGGIIYYLDLNMWLSFVFGGILYVVLAWVFKVITREDLELLNEAKPTRIVNWLMGKIR